MAYVARVFPSYFIRIGQHRFAGYTRHSPVPFALCFYFFILASFVFAFYSPAHSVCRVVLRAACPYLFVVLVGEEIGFTRVDMFRLRKRIATWFCGLNLQISCFCFSCAVVVLALYNCFWDAVCDTVPRGARPSWFVFAWAFCFCSRSCYFRQIQFTA